MLKILMEASGRANMRRPAVIVKAAMSCDYSWQNLAGKYMEFYHTMKSEE